jgi:glycosyltransferase involved in cell wall biosynthesis
VRAAGGVAEGEPVALTPDSTVVSERGTINNLQDEPFVSVIVPTYNRATVLRRCLEALLGQRCDKHAYEVVIVDDGSEDDTPRVVAELAQSRGGSRLRYVREPHLGMVKARIKGIETAQGELIAFIDDDAFAPPSWLEHLVEAAREPGVGMVGGPIRPAPGDELRAELDDRGRRSWSGFYVHPRSRLTDVDFVPGGNMALWRWAIEAVGGFDAGFTGLATWEETDVCVRLKRRGLRIVFDRDAPVDHVGVRTTPMWEISPRVQYSFARNRSYFVVKNFRTLKAFVDVLVTEQVRWLGYQLLRTLGLALTFPARLAGGAVGVGAGLLARRRAGAGDRPRAIDGRAGTPPTP